MREPRYSKRSVGPSVLDPYKEQLVTWLKAESLCGKRDRCNDLALFQAIRAMGYRGSRGGVQLFCKQWRHDNSNPRHAGFIPLAFEPGEAFQFDWSTEYAFISGLRRRLEVAHMKLAASRVFMLVAYFSQAHEVLFDAHSRCFAALSGVPRRGIYDNMRTAVDKVGAGKQRSVNACFQTTIGHYLFKEEFCNRASGWKQGIVEKTSRGLALLNGCLASPCNYRHQSLFAWQWPCMTAGVDGHHVLPPYVLTGCVGMSQRHRNWVS